MAHWGAAARAGGGSAPAWGRREWPAERRSGRAPRGGRGRARAAGIPGPEGPLRGAPGRAPPARALQPRCSARARERPDPGPGLRIPQRHVLLLSGRQAQSRKHLHLPTHCLNAAPRQGPGEGAPGLPRPAPLGTRARGRTGWRRGDAVAAGSDVRVTRRSAAPPRSDTRYPWPALGVRGPAGPLPAGPSFPRPAHAPYDLGAGAAGALATSRRPLNARPADGASQG